MSGESAAVMTDGGRWFSHKSDTAEPLLTANALASKRTIPLRWIITKRGRNLCATQWSAVARAVPSRKRKIKVTILGTVGLHWGAGCGQDFAPDVA
jgi:hypothetical protein